MQGLRLLPNLVRIAGPSIPKRGLRAVRKLYRTQLPKYRLDFRTLPPLTKLLTDSELDQIGMVDALQLRRDKIALYMKYLPTNSNTNLLEAIFNQDNDIDRLLRIVDENLETMTSFYVGVSFEAIDDMMRANLCDKSTVKASPEFRKLSEKALYKMRFLEPDEVLKVIKCLSTLQLPGESLLVQATLQMARHFIDDFSITELRCLDRELRNFSTSEDARKSILLALSHAIPLAIQKRIDEKQLALDRPKADVDRNT